MYKKTPQCQVKGLVDLYHSTFGYIENGFFVEVGAFNGYNWSNTYCLSRAGWQGLLVEPHPAHFLELQELYKDNQRMILENICIGKINGTAKLYLGGSNSTISSAMVNIYNDIEWSRFSGLNHENFIECRMLTLDTILRKHNCLDRFEVLVVDVEGTEKEVLKGFSIEKWQPHLAIIETHEKNEDKRLSKKSGWINAFFDRHHYRKIYSDHINSIYEAIKR